MSVKDFFVAVIKIFAIYIFIEGVVPIISNIIYFNSFNDIKYLLSFIGIILLFLAIVYLMLTFATQIVSFLRLDKGFEATQFDFSKTDSNYIVEIVIALMGVYLLFVTVPNILLDGFILLKSNVNSYSFGFKSPELSKQNLYNNLLYVLVGIIIIFLRKSIANIFTSKS